MNVITKAAQFANRAHEKSPARKYTGEAYIYHPLRVAGELILVPDVPEHVVAAGWLHDVVEDCPDFRYQFYLDFDADVIEVVGEVTNPSALLSEAKRLRTNRRERKAMDFAHIAVASRWGKILKLLDRDDNLNNLHLAEIGYRKLYCDETLLLIDAVLKNVVGDIIIGVLVAKLLAKVHKIAHLGVAA